MSSTLAKPLPLKKVLVVGGGVSGLSYTYYLAKLRPDIHVTLLEASHRCRGYINSCLTDDGQGHTIMVEKGPRTLRGGSDGAILIIDTLKQLRKENYIYFIDSNNEANKKYLLDENNKLVLTPNSFPSFMKFLMNPLGKGLISGLLGEPFRKARTDRADETAHDMFSRRFGNSFISDNLLSSLYHGIFADDVRKLSAQHAAAKFYEMERNNGSFIKSFLFRKTDTSPLSTELERYQQAFGRNKEDLVSLKARLNKIPMLALRTGLETLPKALLEASTKLSNVSIHTRSGVSKLYYDKDRGFRAITEGSELYGDFDNVRINISPNRMANIFEDPAVSEQLNTIKANTVLLVNFYLPYRDVLEPYHGFGYLVPRSNSNPEKLLGVIFDSVVERNSKALFSTNEAPLDEGPYTKLTAMLGGHYLDGVDPNNIPSREETIEYVKRALFNHVGISEHDLKQGHWEVTIARDCLPKFHVGYKDWVSNFREMIDQKYQNKISLGGMAFSKGPGLPDVFMNSFTEAFKASKTL